MNFFFLIVQGSGRQLFLLRSQVQLKMPVLSSLLILGAIVLPHLRFFISELLFYTTNIPPWFFRQMKVSTSSKIYPSYFGCLRMPGASLSHFTASATVSIFLPPGIFYLALFFQHFGALMTQMRAGSPHPGLLCVCFHIVLDSG